MPTVPRFSYLTAERKVRMESFPDIKPRRGVVGCTSRDISATPDCDMFTPKLIRTPIKPPKHRSSDQIRQAAGRSGGVFEIAANAMTPWELQYCIAEEQEIFDASNRTFSLESRTNKHDEGSMTSQISVPTTLLDDSTAPGGMKSGPMTQKVHRYTSSTSRPNGDDTVIKSVQSLSGYRSHHSLDFDLMSWSEFESSQEVAPSPFSDACEDAYHAQQEGLVSRWSATTSSTDELAPDSKVARHVSTTESCITHAALTFQIFPSTSESMQSQDYAHFRRQYYDLLDQGYECSHAYDQVMYELTETEMQNSNDGNDGLTECEGYKKQDTGLVFTNPWLVRDHRQEAYRLLSGGGEKTSHSKRSRSGSISG